MKSREFGFTLVEVLVAVTILAIAMSALIASGSGFVRDVTLLRDRHIASWIAQNRIAEVRLTEKWPSIGERSGFEVMVGNEWEWRTVVKKTPDEKIRKLRVQVSSTKVSEFSSLITIDSFLAKKE
ncbi:MAG: type II secretion system minor pseudopilin GspI [Gammaproteobacteria bacterium]|nr:type II secretion system minor pseudopilin GspI [Gammaproteobacteria bacterium]MBT4607539.1 type II secretion system minor pseudopilin GspI [Thiotrichales bacterium]MBT3967182.1 type II secretion system minor pseudopilin GspI [Gammaproteobacteria bacterium]MBT4080778.1 type II secretion system minor pseudopilin GspI [Gammaproteobacteria bacterium]MBT4330817.1 type II secretion system minor pseudopilin GspI [Gammaproteobacteria bacterium]